MAFVDSKSVGRKKIFGDADQNSNKRSANFLPMCRSGAETTIVSAGLRIVWERLLTVIGSADEKMSLMLPVIVRAYRMEQS